MKISINKTQLILLEKHISICLTILFFSVACSKSKSGEEDIQEIASKNDLPQMTITKIDGSLLDLRTLDKRTVLIFFKPDCDHCQREAKQIKDNLVSFKDYSLYFITSDPIEQIEKFAVDYELKDESNVFFGRTESQSILSNYGSISAPSLYIYSDQQLLSKSFDGEVPIETVIPFL